MIAHYPYSGIQPNIKIWQSHVELTDDDKDYLLENVHYMTLRELSDAVGCSVCAVHRYLKSKGISRKTKKQLT